MTDAGDLLAELGRRGWTLAVAESLTGGAVADRIVSVPGASAVFRGGVVAYATELKSRLLGVDPDLLARRSPVDPEVARQLAAGVRGVCGVDVGIGTTGVAGPDPQGGHPVGEVHVAVATPAGTAVRTLALSGGRAEIRAAAVDGALALALQTLGLESE